MKRLFTAAFFVAVLFAFSIPAAAQSVRTFTLANGETMSPASPGLETNGVTTFYSGLVHGQVTSTNPATFTFSLTFKSTGVVDEAAGIYSGEILSPYSSFAVTELSGRKSVSTSGTIDAGVVTYRLTTNGMAEIISVSSNNLTVWQGKNRRRTAVGSGTVNYTDGSGTMTLVF